MKRDDYLKKILIQGIKFIGLSGIGWLLDFSMFAILKIVSANLVVNNIISSWVGVSFVFLFATRKVFQNNSRISLKCKYFVYLLYQCVLIFVISKILERINGFILANVMINNIETFSPLISKILVTPITIMLNFIVMKGIIERL